MTKHHFDQLFLNSYYVINAVYYIIRKRYLSYSNSTKAIVNFYHVQLRTCRR